MTFLNMNEYRYYYNNQQNYKQQVINLGTQATNKLETYIEYLSDSQFNSIEEEIDDNTSNLPNYLSNLRYQSSSYWESQCSSHRAGQRRRRTHWHGCTKYRTEGYHVNINNNFIPDINNRKAELEKLKNDSNYNPLIYNNNDNDNSLMNMNGPGKNLIYKGNKTYEMFFEDYKSKLSIISEYSTNILDVISNNKKSDGTNVHPQYSQAKDMNDLINESLEFVNNYAMNQRSSFNSNYSYWKKKDINRKLKNIEDNILNFYTDKNSSTHVGIYSRSSDSAFLPINPNLENKANAAWVKCNMAVQQSQVYEYGTQELFGLWSDVSNAIPGNGYSVSLDILQASEDSCAKWVDMFNVWQKQEEEASKKPCGVERPDQNANDDAYIKRMYDFFNASSTRIQKIKERLEYIKIYCKNYPDILKLRPEDVIQGPHTIPATTTIKYDMKNKDLGVAPTQYLEIILPNGIPGEIGDKGDCGIEGKSSKNGKRGPKGIVGDPTIPNKYA